MKTNILFFTLINTLVLIIGLIFLNEKSIKKSKIGPIEITKEPEREKVEEKILEISNPQPSYLDYPKIIDQLKKWNKEVGEITEIGSYGKSSKGLELYYIRLTNTKIKEDKPKVLITACIHGNEPLATATVMWYIGNMLQNYILNDKIKKLFDTRDVYFIPVVSPDSYPKSRYVDGVDPNRNFPKINEPNQKSVAPVGFLMEFFKKIKPKAVISSHTWGRVFLIPFGDTMEDSKDHDSYVKIIGDMAKLSKYRYIKASDMYLGNGGLNNPPIRAMGLSYDEYKYSVPIYGTELDWYYRNGAFATVMEFGTHQRIPSDLDIKTEFDMTYEAFLYFLEEAPKVELK